MSTAAPPTLPPGGPGTAGAIGGLALTDALRGILRAIHDRPDDDTPRGAFADELEAVAGTEPCPLCEGRGAPPIRPADLYLSVREARAAKPCERCRGRGWVPDAYAAWAEFIRVQIELDTLVATINAAPHEHGVRSAERAQGLQRREQELLEAVAGLGLPVGIGSVQVSWRRGFVEACEVSAEAWERYGDALRAVHPVRRVVLTTWPGHEHVSPLAGLAWWALREPWHTGATGTGVLVVMARRAAEVKAGAERAWKGVTFDTPPW